MNEVTKRAPMRMLILISGPKLAEKADALFKESHLPLRYLLRGQGTATSETMDMLGLGSTAKSVSISMMPKPFAAKMLARLNEELQLEQPGSGVAFTTAITGISTPAMRLVDETTRKEWVQTMENDTQQMVLGSEHSLIMAAVNQGYSEEVMDAARQAGAHGGTVLHARQMGGEEAMRFWGITIQEEKEMVLILAKAGEKKAIMQAVSEQCGIHSEARGLVFSLPIDMISGLSQGG